MPHRRPVRFTTALFIVVCALIGAPAWAQVSLTSNATVTQTVDSLASSGTANPWTDNTTIPGWYAQWGTTT
ncbi:MAG TPA: hypothetical protein VF698_10725, partial [Thermoanaerobaculia bacterium]